MSDSSVTVEIISISGYARHWALQLSTESCAICEDCAYPAAPCRHPDKMFPCVESQGILVTELCEKYGMEFFNGNIVTWVSLILYR